MLEPIVAFFDKFVEQFSIRRVVAAIVFAAIGLLLLLVFEAYTETFKLSRINKTLSLVERAAEVYPKITRLENNELKDSLNAIVEEIDASSQSIVSIPAPRSFYLNPRWLRTGLSALIWFLLWMIIRLTMKDPKDTKNASIGVFMVALPFVVIAALIPDLGGHWSVNMLAYPFVHFILVLFAITRWHKWTQKRTPKTNQH